MVESASARGGLAFHQDLIHLHYDSSNLIGSTGSHCPFANDLVGIVGPIHGRRYDCLVTQNHTSANWSQEKPPLTIYISQIWEYFYEEIWLQNTSKKYSVQVKLFSRIKMASACQYLWWMNSVVDMHKIWDFGLRALVSEDQEALKPRWEIDPSVRKTRRISFALLETGPGMVLPHLE